MVFFDILKQNSFSSEPSLYLKRLFIVIYQTLSCGLFNEGQCFPTIQKKQPLGSGTKFVMLYIECMKYVWKSSKKSQIRETLNLLTDADSITIVMKRKKYLLGGSNYFWGRGRTLPLLTPQLSIVSWLTVGWLWTKLQKVGILGARIPQNYNIYSKMLIDHITSIVSFEI